jgi:hypothetical protein
MAAGLGFKDFTTGEVLTAADVDGYLMQGVWVFASAAARDAAVTSPQEGNFAYLKDTNVTTYYTGSAWANLDTTGMTNPMTTTGDVIYSSSGSTPARLGIGTAGQVLRVNSGATAPEWAAPAAGGMTQLGTTTTLSGSTTSITSIVPTGYNYLYIEVAGIICSANNDPFFQINTVTTTTYQTFVDGVFGTSTSAASRGTRSSIPLFAPGIVALKGTGANNIYGITITNPNASIAKNVFVTATYEGDVTGFVTMIQNINANSVTSAVSSLEFKTSSGTFSGGTVKVYGVK